MHIQQAHKTTEQEHTAVVTAILFEAVVTAILSEAVVTARWSLLGTLQPMWRILVCANKKACTLGHPCIYCSHEEIVSSTSRASNWCRRQQPASFSPPPCTQNEREREREGGRLSPRRSCKHDCRTVMHKCCEPSPCHGSTGQASHWPSPWPSPCPFSSPWPSPCPWWRHLQPTSTRKAKARRTRMLKAVVTAKLRLGSYRTLCMP